MKPRAWPGTEIISETLMSVQVVLSRTDFRLKGWNNAELHAHVDVIQDSALSFYYIAMHKLSY